MAAKIANNEELLAAIVTAFDYKITELKEHHSRELHEIREQLSAAIVDGDTHRNKVMELLLALSAAKPTRSKATTAASAGEPMPESASSFWRNNYLTNDACLKSLADNECVKAFLKSIKKASLEEMTVQNKNKFGVNTWDAMVKTPLKGIDFDGNEVELNRQTVTEMMQAYIKSKADAAAADVDPDAIDDAIDGTLADEDPEPAPAPAPVPATPKKTAVKPTAVKPAAPAVAAPAAKPAVPAANKPAPRRAAAAK